MGKLLFWILLIIAVLLVARIAGRMAAARQSGDKPTGSDRSAQPKPLESMVRCAHCGIHLPRSEALLQNGQTWCSSDHAKLGPRKH